MWKMSVCAAISLCVIGCDALPTNDEATAKQRVIDRLKDPESARFSENFIVNKDGQSTLICGQVNAKNSFGGYTGMTTFIIWQDEVFLASGDGQSIDALLCCDTIITAGQQKTATWNMEGFGESCGQLAKAAGGTPFSFSQY